MALATNDQRPETDVVMSDQGTSRIRIVGICMVNDAHGFAIDRRALVHMMFGCLPWVHCCGQPIIVVTRAVPIVEVKA